MAAKFVRIARENERRSREKNKLLPPQSPRSFSALARLYYLARPTKTAMLRRLFTSKATMPLMSVKITYAVVKAIIFAPENFPTV